MEQKKGRYNRFWATLIMAAILSIPLICAGSLSDCTIYGNCKPVISGITFNNNTGNVNNSLYWQGFTPVSYQLAYINGSFVPYIGANQNVNIGMYSFISSGTAYLNSILSNALTANYSYIGSPIITPYYVVLSKDSGISITPNASQTSPYGLTYSDGGNNTAYIGYTRNYAGYFSNTALGGSSLYLPGYGKAFTGTGNASLTGRMTSSDGFDDGTMTIHDGAITGGVSATFSGLGKFGNITSGNVCYSNGTGCNATSLLSGYSSGWQPNNATENNNYNTTGNVTADNLKATGSGLIWSDGTTGSKPIPDTTNGKFFMWLPSKGALRVGEISGSSAAWNEVNIGNRSYAFGRNTKAYGNDSFVAGDSSIAGTQAVAIGAFCVANNTQAVAIGRTAIASGVGTVSIGYGSSAEYFFDTAIGYYVQAKSASGSIAIGLNADARLSNFSSSGRGSVAIGIADSTETIASTGTGSVVIGQNLSATANNAYAFGKGYTNSEVNSAKFGWGSVATTIKQNGINTTGNITIGNLIQLNIMTLPDCVSATNGTIGRNDTGVYGCSHAGVWSQLF